MFIFLHPVYLFLVSVEVWYRNIWSVTLEFRDVVRVKLPQPLDDVPQAYVVILTGAALQKRE